MAARHAARCSAQRANSQSPSSPRQTRRKPRPASRSRQFERHHGRPARRWIRAMLAACIPPLFRGRHRRKPNARSSHPAKQLVKHGRQRDENEDADEMIGRDHRHRLVQGLGRQRHFGDAARRGRDDQAPAKGFPKDRPIPPRSGSRASAAQPSKRRRPADSCRRPPASHGRNASPVRHREGSGPPPAAETESPKA